jgi:hypothetical protein
MDKKKLPIVRGKRMTPAQSARLQRNQELNKASDRICAIVWGATVHDLLKTLVQKKLIKHNEHSARLLGAEGPLANFSVLHNLAHAMGLIGDNIRNDLHCVREIRNAFAHNVTLDDSLGHPQILTFTSTKVNDHCRNLRCPEIILDQNVSVAAQLTWKRLGWGKLSRKTLSAKEPRTRFEWTCRCLAYILQQVTYGHTSRPRQRIAMAPIQKLTKVTSDWCTSGTAVDYPLL